jgi:chromosome segregation ATPase
VITTRIYLEPNDQMLKEINQRAKESGIGKAQFVLEAVDQYLHGGDLSELASTKAALDKAREDLDQRWSEITTLRAEITALKAELSQVRSAYEKVMITNDQIKKGADQAASELEGLRRDQDHYKSTIEMKDKQIGFLEGHVAQLTQSISQLSLKPGEEEIKKKGWRQFWK